MSFKRNMGGMQSTGEKSEKEKEERGEGEKMRVEG